MIPYIKASVSFPSVLIFCIYFMIALGSPGGSDGKESSCNARDLGLIPGSGRSLGEGLGHPLQDSWASPVAQMVKNLPATWETWIQSLGWEDPLKKAIGNPPQCSCLENSMDRGAWQATAHGVTKRQTLLND